jgi:BirA family biotin operon repressor/biotin-[acetyl-CoA-carboxylase] ligase
VTDSGDIWSSTPWPPEWRVDHVDETGSTNADLLAALEGGSAHGRSVLATDHQTAGRGRLERRWEAPPGANLLVSVAFAPVPDPAADAPHRVALAALAASRALRPDVTIELKWPNDLMLDDAKLGGILAQRCTGRDAVVVGLGLNVGWAPEGAAMLGADHHPADVLRRVLEALDELPADVSSPYREALGTLGRVVRLELPDGVVEGLAVDVDAEGRLVLERDGSRHTFDVGDVVHLRPA